MTREEKIIFLVFAVVSAALLVLTIKLTSPVDDNIRKSIERCEKNQTWPCDHKKKGKTHGQ